MNAFGFKTAASDAIEEAYNTNMQLRLTTYKLLRKWTTLQTEQTCYLAALLGYRDDNEMWAKWCEKDTELCKKLAGPHGYAIYKMMQARKG